MFGGKKKSQAPASSGNSEEKIYQLEDGYAKIHKEGVEPCFALIEEGDTKHAFKAAAYVHVYDVVFKMCIQREPYNYSDQLYNKFTEAVQIYCNRYGVAKLTEAGRSGNDVTLLTVWSKRWENHKLTTSALKRLFTYLDRFHTASQDAILPLGEQAYHVYREKVFDKFAPTVRAAILRTIEKERNEEDCDRKLLKEAVLAFEEMGTLQGHKLKLYKEQLEADIVAAAAEFYRAKCRNWISQDSAPHYLRKAEQMIAQEKSRVEAYLNRVTGEPLHAACYKEMLKTQQEQLLDKKTGLSQMLYDDAQDDLKRLFRLYQNSDDDLRPIAERFHDHVAAEGKRIVGEAQTAGVTSGDANNGLVSKLISLHDQYEKIVKDCFCVQINGENQGKPMFVKALKKAFETFINVDEKVSNLLAEYVNEVLKKNSKIRVESGNLENVLSNISHLYFYIHDKDVFERSYQVFLQHRLLNAEFENEHSEKVMIQKLKHGNFGYTNKLEGMFKDVQNSTELIKRFLDVPGAQTIARNIALEVNVCTTAFWPRPEGTSKARCPTDLKQITEAYTDFYVGEHKGHKLEWRYEQGTAEVMCQFNSATRRILKCSTYQMMLLLQFNKAQESSDYKLSYEEVLEGIGLPSYEIGHHLLSMCHPSVRVLKKFPNSAQIENDHTFCINPTFANPLKKINIPTMNPPAVQAQQQADEEKAKNLRRRNQMDAAIVRIMKARKQLKHNVLVSEVITQLQVRFRPSASDVKKRIEALIEQEYLERLPNDRGSYKYLA